ncbi:MAG: hypothetical protein Tsb0020_41780 [Haliangiales bacterium]
MVEREDCVRYAALTSERPASSLRCRSFSRSAPVSAQPDGQLCAVENASGTIDGAAVTDVTVTCASDGTLVIDAGPEFLPLRVESHDFPDGVSDQVLVMRAADAKRTINPTQANSLPVGDAFVELPILPSIDEDLEIRGWYRGTDGTTDYGLISRGMIGMTFTSVDSGAAYTDFSAAAEPIRVAIPMAPDAVGLAPTIDLWRATDGDDTWQLDGTATYDEAVNAYRFEVTRWSVYNLDHKGPRCAIRANFGGHADGDTYSVTLIDFAVGSVPPGPVTDTNVVPDIDNCSMTISWTNPADADYAGVDICVIPSRFQTSCTGTPVTKGATETSHTFTQADGLNCGNQDKTQFEFQTFDNKTPANRQNPATITSFTMQ